MSEAPEIQKEFEEISKKIKHSFEKDSENWSRDQVITVMKKLVDAEDNFLIYEDLCQEMGPKVVDF